MITYNNEADGTITHDILKTWVGKFLKIEILPPFNPTHNVKMAATLPDGNRKYQRSQDEIEACRSRILDTSNRRIKVGYCIAVKDSEETTRPLREQLSLYAETLNRPLTNYDLCSIITIRIGERNYNSSEYNIPEPEIWKDTLREHIFGLRMVNVSVIEKATELPPEMLTLAPRIVESYYGKHKIHESLPDMLEEYA